MPPNDDGDGVPYPFGTRLILLIVLLLHILAVVYLLEHKLSNIDLHRIYESARGLHSSPQPGSFLVVEVLFAYGLFISFLIWIAVSLYRGDDGLAGKAYAICAFIAALVVVGRYFGGQEAGYEISPEVSTLMMLWFILWGVMAASFSFRAGRFQQSRELEK
jgi:hypothetical protein